MKELTEGYEVRKFNGQTKRFVKRLIYVMTLNS